MKRFRLALILALLACVPVALHADGFTFTLVSDANPGGLSFNGGYIGPYNATLGSTSLLAYCVDPMHEVGWGQSWSANVSSLTGDLSNAYLGNAGRAVYEEVAYLLFFSNYAGLAANGQETLQGYVWFLIDPSSTFGADSAYWATWLGSHDWQDANYSNIMIVSDANHPPTGQEFMFETPEPDALILFATGLAGLATFLRRRLCI